MGSVPVLRATGKIAHRTSIPFNPGGAAHAEGSSSYHGLKATHASCFFVELRATQATLTGPNVTLSTTATTQTRLCILASVAHSVKPRDVSVLAIVPVVLLSVGALASYIPARRATRVDPVTALRAE